LRQRGQDGDQQMSDYFASPRQKLVRAKKYIADLERERDLFVNDQQWSYIVEINPDIGSKEFKIRFTGDVSDRFSDIASNALQNLRSALDHSINSTARVSGKRDPRNAYFPFGDTPNGLEQAIKGRCKDVHPDIVSLVRTFRPYRTGNHSPIPWVLNNTANIDKHAMVCPFAGTLRHVIFGGPEAATRPLFIHPPRWDQNKNEIVYAVCAPEESPDCNIHLSIDIAFREIDFARGEAATWVLDAMASEVERVLIAVEAETRRIFPGAF